MRATKSKVKTEAGNSERKAHRPAWETTMNIPPNATGPWGLVDLQKELGSAKNEGRIEHQQYLGGETELTQEYVKLPGFRGHFRFGGEGSTHGQKTSPVLPVGLPA